jgi:release factor glutamine methyltransferase
MGGSHIFLPHHRRCGDWEWGYRGDPGGTPAPCFRRCHRYVAQRNAARHGVADRVRYVQGDLLAPLAGRYTYFIVANPPYLSQAELAAAPPEVARWEPRAALDGGPDGLSVIRHLLVMAAERLHPGAALLVEIGASQGAEVLQLARRHFPQATVEIARDDAERDRLLAVRHA